MKKNIFVTVLLCLVWVLFSCGAKKDAPYEATDYESKQGSTLFGNMDMVWESTGFNPEGPPGVEAQAAPAPRDVSNLYGTVTVNKEVPAANLDSALAERKLVKTTNIFIRVDDMGKASETINNMMKSYGAYSSSTQIEENRQTYVIRVPSSSYEAMLGQVNGLGKVTTRNDSVEDVTLQYYDLEGRLNTRKELLKTYQSYLNKAKNIEEILSVEKKIAELQNEIDSYGSRLTKLANQVDYSTIMLILHGPTPGYTYHEPTILERIKDIFGNYGDFLSGAVIIILQIIIYGIPVLGVVALMFWLLFGKVGLIRRLWRLISKKKE